MSDDGFVIRDVPTDSHTRFAAGTEGRLVVSAKGAAEGRLVPGADRIAVSDLTDVEFLASSSGTLQLWLNGKSIYHRETPQSFRIDSDRFSATLAKGNNRLAVSIKVVSPELPVEFHLRFRRKSAIAQHERLAEQRSLDPAMLSAGESYSLTRRNRSA